MKKSAKKVKRSITLVELLVVMALIAIISGALAYNYRESLDKGKAFKTEQLMERIRTILMLEIAQNPQDSENIISKWNETVTKSKLIKADVNKDQKIIDAWGKEISVEIDKTGKEPFIIHSAGLEQYRKG